ncbi:winged helix-turn-helix domain-containing protein [Candidatus Enterococcus mangumiae]|uniref:Transcriptional regulator n=1 Tax=Candidatus Enterococcus mangumiae TaxID=2230878 RepID=A0ABZ2SXG4_9ENTE|nr:winged helix-turn-helix domain-containing protein [Enterococcus sp. DIV1094]MBO0490143.1 winged helix-turn-helix domain-containing protein [Enterococcus sp. DIV1094]
MSSNLYKNELINYLKNKSEISTEELHMFYRQFTPNLPMNTLRWRIYTLKQQGLIYSPKRGVYALSEKETFTPAPNDKILHIANLLQTKFPYVDFSIYSTRYIGNLSNHVYQTNNLIIEIEIDTLDASFHFLKDQFPNTFVSPDQKMYDYYISPSEENIIINRLYVDAPLNKFDGNFYIPKIEKLIVDLLVNNPIILPISSAEIQTIISTILNTYNINYSTLTRYAKKRNVNQELKQILAKKGEEE